MKKIKHVNFKKDPATNLERAKARFWSLVTKTDGCWIFTARRRKKKKKRENHYGSMWAFGKRMPSNRFSWIIHNGEITAGMCVCHKCDNPPCVNPDHLFLGTHSDNAWDMIKKGRGNQPKGENHHASKCSDKQVRSAILDAASGVPTKVLAKRLGLKHTTMAAILIGKWWETAWAGLEKETIISKIKSHQRKNSITQIRTTRSTLTIDDVSNIRRAYTGKWGELTKIGKEYGVTVSAVWRIVKNLNWKT